MVNSEFEVDIVLDYERMMMKSLWRTQRTQACSSG